MHQKKTSKIKKPIFQGGLLNCDVKERLLRLPPSVILKTEGEM